MNLKSDKDIADATTKSNVATDRKAILAAQLRAAADSYKLDEVFDIWSSAGGLPPQELLFAKSLVVAGDSAAPSSIPPASTIGGGYNGKP